MLLNPILLVLLILVILSIAHGEVSPSPSPARDCSEPEITNERCLLSSKTCHDHISMTACVQFSTTPEKELYLIIQNEGERALNVNATISHLKTMSQKMQILEHQAKKITMSKAVGGSPFIVLHAGNGECIIDMGSLARGGNFFNHVPFVAHLTPISGAYLLFMIAVILGGTWVCCKSKKSGGHVDGVPYQELEMGQPDSFSTKNMGTEDWDEGWDNEWDEKD